MKTRPINQLRTFTRVVLRCDQSQTNMQVNLIIFLLSFKIFVSFVLRL